MPIEESGSMLKIEPDSTPNSMSGPSEEEFFIADEISSLDSKVGSIGPLKILGEKHVTNNAAITAAENMPLLMIRAHHSML
tara:strand:- start:590 stop:832 length:243 start_codon:yes stop_codon:yes gene_type:complete